MKYIAYNEAGGKLFENTDLLGFISQAMIAEKDIKKTALAAFPEMQEDIRTILLALERHHYKSSAINPPLTITDIAVLVSKLKNDFDILIKTT